MLSINTNLSSLIAQSSLKDSTDILNQAIERMTTGYKLNHAKDNAANYSISTNMTTKIGAYRVAEDNASMGLDMITTASDTIGEMQNHAERLRALATQARNGTYGAQSLNALQEEANAIYEEINRLYSTAKYNGVSLFNQSEYDIPDYLPQADPITGFIEDPYDYSEEDIAQMISISKVDSFESGKTYSISSAKELKRFADIVNAGNAGEGSTFVLTEDIDLSEYSDGEGWVPIGDYGTDTNLKFKGTFNGNGHIISNLTINRPTKNYQGLFGRCGYGFQLLNIGIEKFNIIAGSYLSGGLVAQTSGGVVNNCYVIGEISGERVGGLSGAIDTTSLYNSYALANVTGISQAGGLIGELSSGASIQNCFSRGNISGEDFIGGLVGQAYMANGIENSFSSCIVKANSFVGGLIGRLVSYDVSTIFAINDSHSFSTVQGEISRGTGSLLGGALISSDGVNFFEPSITSCSVVKQSFNTIGGVYKSGGLPIDYDISSMLAGIEEIQLRDISTNLQVGIKGESASQLSINTNFELDLGKIVRFGIESDSALSAIDDFVNLLSEKQTELGATQNRLESVLDEISTQYENLVSSRSTIRDVDIAQESSTYIQQQILQQASATLMSTANQSPSIALQLI